MCMDLRTVSFGILQRMNTPSYFSINAKDWVKYEQSNDFKGMTKLSNIARAFEELVKGNRVYKCYSNSTCKEWFSVGLVNGDLVYEDGSSGSLSLMMRSLTSFI
jgi:hypothetical protein